eukprot:7368127-Prymnesium_polylepis.1
MLEVAARIARPEPTTPAVRSAPSPASRGLVPTARWACRAVAVGCVDAARAPHRVDQAAHRLRRRP